MEPTRTKRRRWLIIAFVLVFASLGTWWYLPRGDARFVGTWHVDGFSDDPTDYGEITFWPHGSVQATMYGGSFFPTSWRADGDNLTVYGSVARLPDWLQSLVLNSYVTLSTNPDISPWQSCTYQIEQVTESRLKLRDVGMKVTITFTRIPE